MGFGEEEGYGSSNTVVFNMSLATLQRIDSLMRRLSAFLVLRVPVAAERCAFEFYKEVFPFLTPEERAEAGGLWAGVIAARVPVPGKARYSGLFASLHVFDFWLRDKMLSHGLLMARGESPEFAIQKVGSR